MEKKTYYISITKTFAKIVEVQAESKEEALAKTEKAYYDYGIIDDFDDNDYVSCEFNDETEETINNYELGGMPKFYEVK